MELILEGIAMSVFCRHAARGGHRMPQPRIHQSRWEHGAPSTGLEIIDITLADANAAKASIKANLDSPNISRDWAEAMKHILACLESMQLAIEVENALADTLHINTPEEAVTLVTDGHRVCLSTFPAARDTLILLGATPEDANHLMDVAKLQPRQQDSYTA